MKKLFTVAMALMGLATFANAATVDDVKVCMHSYVLVFDDWDGAGTQKPGKGALFGDGYFLDVTGGTVATNKKSINLADETYCDGAYAKYAAYGEHLNSWRLKNGQDVIAMKVTAKTKLIILGQTHASRWPEITTEPPSGNKMMGDAIEASINTVTENGRFEWIAPDDMTIYIGSYNGDYYVSYLIVEANEAPGTPTIKVGDQTYGDGLWFREVTCVANDATEEGSEESIPTIVTYTTDGSEPTANSDVYTGPITCYKDMTIKFQAYLDMEGGIASEDWKCIGADNEANVNFQFNAPTINADGGNVSIVSEYPGSVKNFYTLNGGEAIEGSEFTLTESATVVAFTEIQNGDYATFTSNSNTQDIYVLNPIKSKKTIAVTAGEVVIDEEATAAAQDGSTVYKIEGAEISADKMDFFVKDLTLKIMQEKDYQVPEGQEIYIQMSNTNITFQVAEGDSVDVKVICTKNSCKNMDSDSENDRKCYVNVNGTNYAHMNAEGMEAADVTLYEDANIIEFGLTAGTYTFKKYSGTGNILISSIEITPVGGGEEPIKGDVNGDGKVDVADISRVLTVMAESGFDALADVNSDSKVDVADISAVLTIMAGETGQE